jgi:hypothetical protein
MTTLLQPSWNDTLPFSDTCVQFSLITNIGQSYTVPGLSSQKYQALFSYAENSNVYVGYNVTALSPTSGTNTTTNNMEYKPMKRFVKGGDVLSIVSPDTAGAYMGMSLRAITG